MTIIVNGRTLEVDGPTVTYEWVVESQGLHGSPSLTYRGAAGPQAEGALSPGLDVVVQDGTVFNVCHTDSA